jgi:hypothetical protein
MATWCKLVISTLFLAFIFVAGSANCQERLDSVGLRRISFIDGDRTLALTMFYPAKSGGKSKPFVFPFFINVRVLQDAPVSLTGRGVP